MSQLKKKSSLYFFAGLTCFTWATSFCLALPSEPIAQSGSVEVEYPNSHTMVIKPSDGAILHYEDFQIGLGEEVRVIQKASSNVQQYVTGKNPSQILGALVSNGKVVLINANGISLGSDSKVEAGSLILSTLDMMDPSHFTLCAAKNSSIVNEGSLRSEKGSIVLLAPHIRNLGSIESSDVLLGSGEQVTFDGANLSVKGSSKESLIEQLGNIKSSRVVIKLPMTKKSIVEKDEAHELFIEEHGAISFGSSSQTKAQKVLLEGARISLQGSINSTNALAKGGNVHLLGTEIFLEGSKIDVSGLTGGGEVLIGGEFQGKGTTPYSSKVIMDELSEIRADSLEKGNGGLVVLWSQDKTLFDGKIYAQGGTLSGDGGLVETSSKGNLNIKKGRVDTLDVKGNAGEWLLDPSYTNIMDGDGGDDGVGCKDRSDGIECSDCDTDISSAIIGTDKFKNLKSNITVLAHSGITIYDSFNVTGTNGFIPSLTLKTCGSGWVSIGDVFECSKNIEITTSGGSINLESIAYLYLQSPKTTITTKGGDVKLSPIMQTSTCQNSNSSPSLVIDAGKGEVTLSTAIQDPSLIYTYMQGSITIKNAKVVNTTGICIKGTLDMSSIPLLFCANGDRSISTHNHDIKIGPIGFRSGYSGSINLMPGSSNKITVGNVGDPSISDMVPPESFSIGNGQASSVDLSNITTKGGDISVLSPVTFSSSATLNPKGGSVFLASVSNLNTVAVSGDVNFADSSTVNGLITADNISFGTSNYISGTYIANGSILSTGSLLLKGTSCLEASNGITIKAQIDTDGSTTYDLTLTAQNSPISIGGDVVNLHSFIISSASQSSFYNITTLGGQVSIACPTMIHKGGGTISSSGGNITFNETIRPIDLTSNDNVGLTIYATSSNSKVEGAISMQGMGDESHSFGVVSLTGGNISLSPGSSVFATDVVSFSGDISLGSSISTIGAMNFSGTVTIVGDTNLKGSKGITIASAIIVSSDNPNFTLDAGENPLTIPSLGSETNPFGDLKLTASNLILEGNVYSNSSILIDAAMSISANTTINSLNGVGGITLLGAVTAKSGNPSLNLNAISGATNVNSLGSDGAPLGAVSLIGNTVYLSGNIASISSIDISGPVKLITSSILRGDKGITLDQDLASNADAVDLTLQASSGTISVKNLGTDVAPLKNISIISTGPIGPGNIISSGNIDLSGTTVTLGPQIVTSGNITITNTGLLTIPSETFSIAGDFKQIGTGAVSLGTSIVTTGSITFAGDVTVSGNTTLRGSKGIAIPGSILPSIAGWNLTLDAEGNPLKIKSLGRADLPFGDLSITTSTLDLGGDVYSSSSIFINAPITISANTTVNSLEGTGGITLLKAVTVVSGSQTPSFSLYAAGGAANVNSLGSDAAPLGDVSLIGNTVFFSGNITSTSWVKITGPVYLLNDKSISLTGKTSVTLDNSLLPNAGLCDLIIQSNGVITTHDLGSSSYPLREVSLTGSSIELQGNITAQSLTINGTTCSSGSCSSGTYTTCPSVSSEKKSR